MVWGCLATLTPRLPVYFNIFQNLYNLGAGQKAFARKVLLEKLHKMKEKLAETLDDILHIFCDLIALFKIQFHQVQRDVLSP